MIYGCPKCKLFQNKPGKCICGFKCVIGIDNKPQKAYKGNYDNKKTKLGNGPKKKST